MASVGFKFGEAASTTPCSIQKAAKVEPFIVGYTDKEGRQQARIAFRVPGSNTSYILQERISAQQVVLPANEWFHKAFVDILQANGFEKSDQESVEPA